jgi:hypothetical protein
VHQEGWRLLPAGRGVLLRPLPQGPLHVTPTNID